MLGPSGAAEGQALAPFAGQGGHEAGAGGETNIRRAAPPPIATTTTATTASKFRQRLSPTSSRSSYSSLPGLLGPEDPDAAPDPRAGDPRLFQERGFSPENSFLDPDGAGAPGEAAAGPRPTASQRVEELLRGSLDSFFREGPILHPLAHQYPGLGCRPDGSPRKVPFRVTDTFVRQCMTLICENKGFEYSVLWRRRGNLIVAEAGVCIARAGPIFNFYCSSMKMMAFPLGTWTSPAGSATRARRSGSSTSRRTRSAACSGCTTRGSTTWTRWWRSRCGTPRRGSRASSSSAPRAPCRTSSRPSGTWRRSAARSGRTRRTGCST